MTETRNTTPADAFDWTTFWTDADETDREDQSPADHHANDVLADFADATMDSPERIADVGCGPGTTVFALAERFPDATVIGYDVAEPVLATNREHARDRGLENARFKQGALPEFDPGGAFAPGGEFDLVFCYFTLCYVEAVERALETLYDAVAPGGQLVFNYQNRLAQSHWRMIAEDPHEFLDEDSAWDPDTFTERFELLIAGENLLSYEAIHDVLGTWPRSVWSVVDQPDIRWAWRHNPLVYLPK